MESSFFKNHADTLAIIAVNITIFAILITMSLANSARTDQLYSMWCDNQKELKQLHVEFIRAHK
jgi:hypothetical protein